MLKEEVLQNVLQKHFKNNLVYEQNTKEKLNDIINKLEKHTRLDIKNYLSNQLKFKVSKGFTKMYEILHKFNLIKKNAKEFV